ncbi:hypothetical protein D3C87_1288900 [compost metagenome]
MPGHDSGAEAADQQGDHGEDARLGEHRDADGQADAQQAFDHRPLRPVETAEQLARLIGWRPTLPSGHAQGHHPHDDGSGPAAADATHGRDAKVAIDEDVVQWNVQGQAAQAKHHGRAGAAQAVTETAQYAIESCGGKAAGNTVQVLHARTDQLRVNLHDVQNGFGVQQCSRCQEPDQQRQP